MISQEGDVHPTHMLLVLISKLRKSSNLTNETIYDIFSKEGSIRRILIFKRGNINKAFVECWSTEDAVNIKLKLDGSNLSKNKGRLLIHFSNVPEIDKTMVVNSRTTEYNKQSSLSSTSDEQAVSPEEKKNKIELQQSHFSALLAELLSNKSLLLNNIPSERILLTSLNLSDFKPQLILNYFVTFGEVLFMYFDESQGIMMLEFKSIESAMLAKEYGHNQFILGAQIQVKYLDEFYFSQLRQLCELNNNWIQNIPSIDFHPPSKKVTLFTTILVRAESRQKLEQRLIQSSPYKIIKILQSVYRVNTVNSFGFSLEFQTTIDAINYISQSQRQNLDGQIFFAVNGY